MKDNTRYTVATTDEHLTILRHAAHICKWLAAGDDDPDLSASAASILDTIDAGVEHTDNGAPTLTMAGSEWVHALSALDSTKRSQDDSTAVLAGYAQAKFYRALPDTVSEAAQSLSDIAQQAPDDMAWRVHPDQVRAAIEGAHEEEVFPDA